MITYIVSLFESTVLLDKVKIITSDDDGTLHLLLTDNTGQNSATERNIRIQGKPETNPLLIFESVDKPMLVV